MGAIEGYDCEGTLTIGGISMNRPAWAVVGEENGEGGLWALKFELEKRGEDRLVPSAAGVIAYPRRINAYRMDLRFLVTGDVDDTGAATADSRVGLEENLAYLYTNVWAPPGSGVTRAATLTMFGGGTIGAAIHVLGFTRRGFVAADVNQSILEGTIQIAIPSGRFV